MEGLKAFIFFFCCCLMVLNYLFSLENTSSNHSVLLLFLQITTPYSFVSMQIMCQWIFFFFDISLCSFFPFLQMERNPRWIHHYWEFLPNPWWRSGRTLWEKQNTVLSFIFFITVLYRRTLPFVSFLIGYYNLASQTWNLMMETWKLNYWLPIAFLAVHLYLQATFCYIGFWENVVWDVTFCS